MINEHKKLYFVHTEHMNWGKGKTLLEAMKNARALATTHVVITILTLKSDTPQEVLDNIFKCYTVESGFGRIVTCSDITEEDSKQIAEYVTGFVSLGEDLNEIKLSVKPERKKATA